MHKDFLGENYFLTSRLAEKLYIKYAFDSPIIDYHCHLDAQEIYEDKPFTSIWDLWLKSDHYKWRLMRNAGVDEIFITGNAQPYDKYYEYVKCLEGAVNNPLYIWSHLELRKYFGIFLNINENNAKEIWKRSIIVFKEKGLSPKKCIDMSKVEAVFTTDDVLSDLKYHKLLSEDSSFKAKVLPTFRGDKALYPNITFINMLQEFSSNTVNSLESYLNALYKRIDFFKENGARASDFAVEYLCEEIISHKEAAKLFYDIISGKIISESEKNQLALFILFKLSSYLAKKDITLQLHIGATRDKNSRFYNLLGKDTGFDGISDTPFIKGLYKLLDELDKNAQLPHTIIYNLNPCYNEIISVLAGCFSSKKKIQLGPAWWFLDNKKGIINHLKAYSENGYLSGFLGMLTDSRSFLSYTRHDYFRRLLCNFIAELADNGEVYYDEEILGNIIKNICYHNAKEFFNL